tara:strand:+ start:1257 stop:3071 length:1815 start_codon:yes stop_codon:yes gene_type:complete
MVRYLNLLISKPRIILEFGEIFYITIYRALSVRFFRGLMMNYPYDVRILANKIPNFYEKKFQINSPKKSILNKKWKLKTASGFLYFNKEPEWSLRIKNHEEFVSLHRLNWLIWGISGPKEDFSKEEGIELIRSYFFKMGLMPKGHARESYTVGERLSNICLFFRQTNHSWDSIPNDIKNVLKIHIAYLSRRLEILPKLTGNHIINNARALLLSGYSCNEKSSIELARILLEKYLSEIFDDNGFLREGSSHYHLLVCRWLLEIRFVAEENNDLQTIKIIKNLVPRVINACKFFIIQDHNNNNLIPLIGDISPDCEPAWITDILSSSLTSLATSKNNQKLNKYSWSNLFLDFENNKKIKWNELDLDEFIFFSNEKSGWYKLVYHDWIAIWHAASSNGPAIASHAHDDFASFCLYKNGKEIIIDPGRYDYENNDFSNYGKTFKAHSLLTVNESIPLLSTRENKIPKSIRQAESFVSCSNNKKTPEVTFTHDGFKRLNKKIGVYKRKYIFDVHNIIIEDSLDGEGSFNLNVFFHKNFNQPPNIMVMSPNQDISHKQYLESINPIMGWRFRSFGKKEPAITDHFSLNTTLPTKIIFKISHNLKNTITEC